MSRDDMHVADTFHWQQSIYGACDPVSKTLLLILAKDCLNQFNDIFERYKQNQVLAN